MAAPVSPPLVVFEDHRWTRFLPLVYLRPLCDLICGTGSLLERVRRLPQAAGRPVHVWTRPALAEVVRERHQASVNSALEGPTLLLSGRMVWHALPDGPQHGSSWVGMAGESVACIWADAELAPRLSAEVCLDPARLGALLKDVPRRDVAAQATALAWPWTLLHTHLRLMNAPLTGMGTLGQHEGRVEAGCHLLAPESVYIGAGARLMPGVVIDAEKGPVWIEPGVRVLPHVFIQGPAYVGAQTVLQPGAVVRDGTYVGPVSKVGGELDASVIQGYSNKQHDGFLGHSYVGSWVNIAADCINSDLKNTYGTVRMPINGRPVETGEQFVGLLMGDHVKTAINVSFPTGAVIGCSSSIIVTVPPSFVPSFGWLDDRGLSAYDVERGVVLARRVMARRQVTFSAAEEAAYRHAETVARDREVHPL